ncbi:hypothetical protein [Niabella hibiscisoli]|uniref:hypothetical protein n=1 Tax=Niabella hibiscisoli TaxID=1825928 RepID=UPI001F10B791|nr:hypothetical protein [Niabella hibiscisoli]MCH5715433.1 hypothetical protein [Niabella hibiscisoli]
MKNVNKAKTKPIDKTTLMEWYSDYLLTHGRPPESVYQFAKTHQLAEAHFYDFFSGFDSLEQAYLVHFFEKSLELAGQIEHFDTMPAKEKLLNLYFILFENFKLNRSLILLLLKGDLVQQHRLLRALKSSHRQFSQTLSFDNDDIFEKAPEFLKQFNGKSKEGVLWLHFLSVLEFWKKMIRLGLRKRIYISKKRLTPVLMWSIIRY